MFLKPLIVFWTLAGAAVADRGAASAGEILDGPLPAAVERIVDGDTLAVRVRIWLNQELQVLVRIRGIDAPETRGGCAEERALADRARAHLTTLIGGGSVVLHNIEGGKYWGRVIADVVTGDGRDAALEMLRARLARPYDGGKRMSWCETAAGEPIN